MPLTEFVPEFFSQQLSPLEMPSYPRMGLASTLMVGVGNALSWPDLEGNIQVGDYTDNGDVVYQSLTDKVYKVTIANNKLTGWYVTDIERTLRIPQAMANGMAQSLREQRVAIETILRSAYRNTARLAASGLTEPTRAGRTALTSNVTVQEMLHEAGTGDAHPKWNTPEGRLAMVKALQSAADYAARHFWMAQPVATVPREVYNQFLDFLVVDKQNLGEGSLVDSAFTEGKVPRIYGVTIVPENLVQPINTRAPVGVNAGLRMDFHYPGQSVKYILKPVTAEVFRDNDKLRDNGRTLWLSGAGQDAARFLHSIVFQLSAS